MYFIQEPLDVVLFSPLTAHSVLTVPGPAALMTSTLKVKEAEEERGKRLGRIINLKEWDVLLESQVCEREVGVKVGPGFLELGSSWNNIMYEKQKHTSSKVFHLMSF